MMIDESDVKLSNIYMMLRYCSSDLKVWVHVYWYKWLSFNSNDKSSFLGKSMERA